MSIEMFQTHVKSMREEYEKSGHYSQKLVLHALEELANATKKEEEDGNAETGKKSDEPAETEPIVDATESGSPEGSTDGEGYGAGSGAEDHAPETGEVKTE